jgi:hypothetical protein
MKRPQPEGGWLGGYSETMMYPVPLYIIYNKIAKISKTDSTGGYITGQMLGLVVEKDFSRLFQESVNRSMLLMTLTQIIFNNLHILKVV